MRLKGRVAVVAGATRGAGRAMAIELGREGAKVYATGRSSRVSGPSPMNRRETIEETAEMVEAAGGQAVALRVDYSVPAEVAALAGRIRSEEDGRLDILVNDIWGGDPLMEWGNKFWEQSLETGLLLLRQAVETHIITSWHLAPFIAASRGLLVEVTDGAGEGYRGSLFYDLAKASAIRLALAQNEELKESGATALALTPGFLRSEAVLDYFGVTAENWRDAIAKDPDFAVSETPAYVARALVALAADPDVARHGGKALTSWDLAEEYGFTDVDGTQPNWGRHFAATYGASSS